MQRKKAEQVHAAFDSCITEAGCFGKLSLLVKTKAAGIHQPLLFSVYLFAC
jgi:hypothetical protein